jgi:sugar phosphate isomerase/epimerase
MLRLATKFAPERPLLEQAHRAGFHFAEVWLDAAVLADWQAVAALARDYPFGYALHFPNRLEQAGETLEQAVALYRALGCRSMVIHQPLLDRYHEGLMRLGPELRLAVENHKLDPERFRLWAERNPGLALDVEHLWKFTYPDVPLKGLLEEVRRFLGEFGDKLRHVHMPGYHPGMPEHRPMYCARELVFGVLSLLAEINFDGLIVSEVNPEYQNPNDLRMDVLLFETWRDPHDPALGQKADCGLARRAGPS